MADLQSANAQTLRLLGTLSGGHDEERALHRRLKAYRLRGEWFEPSREVLNLIRPRWQAPQAWCEICGKELGGHASARWCSQGCYDQAA